MKWLVFLILASPALADCPPNPDIDDAEAALLSRLLDVKSPAEAQVLNQGLWSLWLRAPDAQSQALLDRAMAQRQGFDLRGAGETLDILIGYCPDYAEGLNQRAFVAFLMNDMEASLDYIDQTLAIRPAHLGAMSGKVLTLIEMGRDADAQAVLRRALRLNPFLPERRFLTEPPGAPL